MRGGRHVQHYLARTAAEQWSCAADGEVLTSRRSSWEATTAAPCAVPCGARRTELSRIHRHSMYPTSCFHAACARIMHPLAMRCCACPPWVPPGSVLRWLAAHG